MVAAQEYRVRVELPHRLGEDVLGSSESRDDEVGQLTRIEIPAERSHAPLGSSPEKSRLHGLLVHAAPYGGDLERFL